MTLIGLYLTAIVTANLLTAKFGPGMSIINSFLFVGLDLTSRDGLHEAWSRKNLWAKMALLIATGSLLSWGLNRGAGQIALASCVAFLLSGIADALTYHWLGSQVWRIRVNGSNLVSGAVDSLVFPTLAFGGLNIWVTFGQFIAKVAGGFLWSLVLERLGKEKT